MGNGENQQDLQSEVRELRERTQQLEELVKVISRGKHMWQSTFDAISLPVQIVNSSYIIERANVGIAKVGQGHITDFVGKKCYEVFAGRKGPCDGCPLPATLSKNHEQQTALKNSIHNREFEATAYPYLNFEPGTEPQAIISYRDVTEERRLQSQVIQQEKMAAIGMLAGGVAHEINNPLGGILAFTQLLLKDVSASGEQGAIRADLEEIERAAQRCKRIVADLLDFSRMEKVRERQFVELENLVQKVLPFINREMRSLNVDFSLQVENPVPAVFGEPNRLQQVFLNLMTNACHAMEKGGKLSILLEEDPLEGGARVTVRDTGAGIAPELVDKIFDPFFTTKDPGKGTGLGLAISYRILSEHGARIAVESKAELGTAFIITFPSPEKSIKGES